MPINQWDERTWNRLSVMVSSIVATPRLALRFLGAVDKGFTIAGRIFSAMERDLVTVESFKGSPIDRDDLVHLSDFWSSSEDSDLAHMGRWLFQALTRESETVSKCPSEIRNVLKPSEPAPEVKDRWSRL